MMYVKSETENCFEPYDVLSTLLHEYDEILVGKRRSLSMAYLKKESSKNTCALLLKIIFDKYLHWSPVTVRDALTPAIAERMCLMPIIKHLRKADEATDASNLCWVAWMLYPETRNVSEAEIVLDVYKRLMEGKIQRFPKKYFLSTLGDMRATLIVRAALIEYILPKYKCATLQEVYALFSKGAVNALIKEFKLSTLVQQRFHCPLNMLHIALQDQASDDLYFEAFNAMKMRNKWEICMLSHNELVKRYEGVLPKDYLTYLNQRTTGRLNL